MIFFTQIFVVQLNYFYDSLNTVVIVAPDGEFFSPKYAQFLLAFKGKSYMMNCYYSFFR